jgi:hypothetical protein
MTVSNQTGGSQIAGYQPAGIGMQAWTYDPVLCSQASAPAGGAGVLNLARVHCPAPVLATSVRLYVAAAGVTLTAGQNFAGLYTAGGNLIASSADLTAGAQSWATVAADTFALAGGPFALAGGDYYVGWYWNGTTAPTFARQSGVSSALNNTGVSAPNLRYATAAAGLTSALPGSTGAQSPGNVAFWAGIS